MGFFFPLGDLAIWHPLKAAGVPLAADTTFLAVPQAPDDVVSPFQGKSAWATTQSFAHEPILEYISYQASAVKVNKLLKV